ncbi:MAG: hypothetical protein PVG64_01105 [Syntrophobacterales bacterium]|jgi:hypothetical protein
MKITKRPLLTTILYGMACGVSFIPMMTALSQLFHWPIAFRLTIWLILAGYLVLLTRWGRARFVSVIFPLLLLLLVVFWGGSNTPFLFLGLGILSWVRSGICFQGGLLKTLTAEIAISLGGGGLVSVFAPHTTITWAMAVWMFFLVQSLYFVVVRDIGEAEDEHVSLDAFEQARGQAEKILSTEIH